MAERKKRTATQKMADSFDCDLYRLIARAERSEREGRGYINIEWGRVAIALAAARSPVRRMMHPDDIKETQ